MAKNEFLKAALKYQAMGFSVIPIKANKKPFIKWASYQQERADAFQLTTWWSKWPDAMVGIVTGKISGLTVLDPDTAKGMAALEEFLPDSLETPTATTPHGGRHFWFQHVAGIPNKARILTECDTRNDGGYVVCPPSSNGKGRYAWLPGLSPLDVEPAAMPDMLADTLKNASLAFSEASGPGTGPARSAYNKDNSFSGESGKVCGDCYAGKHSITKDNKNNISFEHGTRDDSLFHVANMLIKGGESPDNTFKILQMLASTWGRATRPTG